MLESRVYYVVEYQVGEGELAHWRVLQRNRYGDVEFTTKEWAQNFIERHPSYKPMRIKRIVEQVVG